jgi:flagellar biosynthetic protein FliR
MLTEAAMFAYLMVFLRAGAMMFTAPIFSAQNTPVTIRILTTVSLTAALTFVVQAKIGPMPADMYSLLAASLRELFAGLLIGSFMNLALQVAQIAGSFMDMQVGLSSAQIMNPVSGISVTVLSQYKFMLGVVIFLSLNAHHILIKAFVRSYDAIPGLSSASLPGIEQNYVRLLTSVFMIAVQIALPVTAVGLLVDSGLGLIGRAVPQMQVAVVGLPAKIALGLMAVSIGLPALTIGISAAVNQAMVNLNPLFPH